MALILSHFARAAAFLVGAAIVAFAVNSWQMPRGSAVPPARVGVSVKGDGPTAVAPAVGENREFVPAQRILEAAPVAPGRPAAGRIVVGNFSGRELAIRMRARPATRDLDPLLAIQVRHGQRSVWTGRLERLRNWTGKAFRIAPGKRAGLTFELGFPASVRSGYEGRDVDLPVELLSEPVGGA